MAVGSGANTTTPDLDTKTVAQQFNDKVLMNWRDVEGNNSKPVRNVIRQDVNSRNC